MESEERVVVLAEHMESLENALGFYPYGDETQVDISDNGEFVVPQDVRTYLIEKVMEGALGSDDIVHARALRRLEIHASEELENSVLREYQQEVVHGVKDFLQYPKYDDSGNPVRRGYVKLPTATGKTAIFAHTVQEITNHISSNQKRLKTLVLVPGRDLVEQTVGTAEQSEDDVEAEEMTRGFAKFAPNLHVSEYHGGKKDLSGDVVVMTYQSLVRAVRENRFDSSLFDVVIGDEIHQALGTATRRSIAQAMDGKIAIGFSATTEYAKNKTVKDLMPTEIYRLELRQAIEKNYLAPVRAIAITTGDTLKAFGHGEFKEKELAKLIESEWRNKTAINVAKEFVAEGQQGIITCLPGQNVRHARDIAKRLSDESIIDVTTGKIRNVIAKVVHGEMSVAERKAIYRAYEKGDVDVLTAVDLLNEGWDSVSAKFLINLRPTTSAVLGIQRLGRILRPTEDGKIATVVEFIDNIEKPGKGIFTFYHAMGEIEVVQGKIHGGPTRPSEPGEDPLPFPEIPTDLKEIIGKMNHKILEQLIFGNLADLSKKGYATKNSISQELGLSSALVLKIIEGLDITGSKMLARKGNNRTFYSPEDQEKIKTYIEENRPPDAPDDYVIAAAIAKEYGCGPDMILKIAENIGIEGTRLWFKYAEGTGYSSKEQVRITEYLKSSDAPRQLDGYVSASNIADATGYSWSTINKTIAFLGVETVIMRSRANNNLFPYVSPEDESQITQYLQEYGIPKVEKQAHTVAKITESEDLAERIENDEYVSRKTIGEITGWSDSKVSQLAKKLGITGTSVMINNGVSNGFNYEERALLISELGKPAGPKATAEDASASSIAKQTGRKAHHVQKAAEELGIDGMLMRFGSQTTTGFNTEEQQRITAHLGKQYVEVAPEGYLSAQGIKKHIGRIGYKTIVKAINELGIDGKLLKFQNKPGLGYSPEEQEIIITYLRDKGLGLS